MQDRNVVRTTMKSLRVPTIALTLVVCISLSVIPAKKTYSSKNPDEVEIISLVLASEVRASNWTKDELICLSIENKDPDKKLIRTFRQQGLSVCRLSEWQRNFACGFQVYLRFINFDSPQTARLHADVADVREINSGSAHIAIRLRGGEYTFHKTEGNWSIGEYVPSK